ncbi:MAG TPA: hypothetical protein VLW45_09700 [Pelomicrobium sp.]|nr:hypothetical protein [Pelomicrobium sp.]
MTITIGKDTLRRARLRARAEGTSVSAAVRAFLERYVRSDSVPDDAVIDLLRLARMSRAKSGPRSWDRDELHER